MIKIRRDENGEIDEIVGPCHVHLERMDEDQVTIVFSSTPMDGTEVKNTIVDIWADDYNELKIYVFDDETQQS